MKRIPTICIFLHLFLFGGVTTHALNRPDFVSSELNGPAADKPVRLAVYKSDRQKRKKKAKAAGLKKAKREKRKKKSDHKKDVKRARDKRNNKGGIIDDETQKVRDADTTSWHHGNDFNLHRRLLNHGAKVDKYHKEKRSKDQYGISPGSP